MFSYLCAAAFVLSGSLAAASQTSVGVVKFRQCVEDSALGKEEHDAFEALRNHMQATLQDKEKALNEVATKFQDADFMDSLTPEKEAELKHKFRVLSQDLGQFQNEYYQQLNQANMRVMQEIARVIGEASRTIATKNGLDVIVNEDNCFYFAPTLDVTTQVIGEMDRMHKESKSES
ncbi:MAG: OmpH family outer membrane protein [Chlamydiia bacterium]|nr:OmpH family outer membrane protein [Chlamydiia bacterium]